jgi:hypothetical protein
VPAWPVRCRCWRRSCQPYQTEQKVYNYRVVSNSGALLTVEYSSCCSWHSENPQVQGRRRHHRKEFAEEGRVRATSPTNSRTDSNRACPNASTTQLREWRQCGFIGYLNIMGWTILHELRKGFGALGRRWLWARKSFLVETWNCRSTPCIPLHVIPLNAACRAQSSDDGKYRLLNAYFNATLFRLILINLAAVVLPAFEIKFRMEGVCV